MQINVNCAFRCGCGKRMDKIGEAIKPSTLDLLEVEKRKKDDDDKTVTVYQPRSSTPAPSSRSRWA